MIKKITCFAIAIVLMICAVIPVSAYSSNNNQINGFELSVRRISAKMLGKSDLIIAQEILTEFGISENLIKRIPEDRLIELVQSKSIGSVKEYCKISDNEQVIISKADFEQEKLKDNSVSYVQPLYQGDSGEFNGTDELLEKTLIYFETKNAPKGTYGIWTAYDFIKYSTRYHGEDVLAQAGEHLSFNKSSFCMVVSYNYQMTTSAGIVYGSNEDIFDIDIISADEKLQNKLKQADYAITFEYNLKNNIWSPTAPLIYTNASFLMIAKAKIDLPNQQVNFNIRGDYFHQKVGLGSLGVSVNIQGASVSVSPKAIYDQHQISTLQPVTYNPY